MTSTKVIATTWAKKDLVAKLKATIKRMDDEITEWEKDSATIEKRRAAWEKKAEAWVKKNIAKATKFEIGTGYANNYRASIYFDTTELEETLGKYPQCSRSPEYKTRNYSKPLSDYDQVENAIAIIQGSTDTEFKITTTSTWAQFIR